MASNKDLVAQAAALAAELGKTVTTDGLNNEKLTALVAELEAEKASKASDGAPPPAGGPPPAPPAPPAGGDESAKRAELRERAVAARVRATEAKDRAAKAMDEAQRLATVASQAKVEAEAAEAAADPDKAVYRVAEGKSLHTLSGALGAFQEVRARDLSGGRDELEQLIKAGFVVIRA